MALIKRFESLVTDTNLESCKDIIETISEYEDEVVVLHYEEGYYSYKFSKKIESEKEKKAIQFYLCLKSDQEDRKINNKSDFDKMITLMQRSKSLYSKLSIYCESIKVSIEPKSISFILTFDNTDESVKRPTKVKRIFGIISKYLSDYNNVKTFNVDDSVKKEYSDLITQIKKSTDESERLDTKGFEFRFTTDIDMDLIDDPNNSVITIKTKTFRYKYYGDNKWIKVRSNKEIVNLVNKKLIAKIKSHYLLDKDKGDLLFLNQNGIITINIL